MKGEKERKTSSLARMSSIRFLREWSASTDRELGERGEERVLVVRVAEKGRRFGQRVAAGRSARGFGDAMVDMLRATDLGHATQVFEADRAVAVFDDTSRFLVIRTIFGVVGFLIADCYNKL